MTGREAEDQANRFASSFLMPEGDVLAHLPYVSSLNKIIEKKARWKVSVAALNYRLHKLRLTTEWHNRTLCIQIARAGYGKREPYPIERELSVVWEKVLRSLWTERVTRAEIAKALHLPASEVESLVFGVLGNAAPRPERKGLLSVV